MFNFIEKLRAKSEGHRRGVAFGTSFVVTLAIFFVWVSVKFPTVIPGNSSLASEERSAVASANSANKEVRSAGFASAISNLIPIEEGFVSDLASNSKSNIATAFEAVKSGLGALGKYFGETRYEADEGDVEYVPTGSTGPSSVETSATNRQNSVIY